MSIPITPLAPVAPPTLTPMAPALVGSPPPSFGAAVAQALQGLQDTTGTASQAVTGALTGQTSITEAMIATTKAQTALQVAADVRNALVQSAQSFLNLQI